MSDEADSFRSLGPKTPSTPKKMPRKQTFTAQKRTVVSGQSMCASFSEDSNSQRGGADESKLGINEDEMKPLSPRQRVRSFNDEDSPWQNGQFKSPKEIVNYYRQQLGDWWNILPKTDYTYDERSKWYRKEIAPGIPVIPNLARPPLHPVQDKSRFNFFSRSPGYTFEASSSNGKSQFARFPILQQENKSMLSKLADFLIYSFLGLLCLPYDLFFGNLWSSKSSVSGHITSNESTWWTAPFRWLYQLMMLLFAAEIKVLVSFRRLFNNLVSQTALKLFFLSSVISSIILVYVHYGVELNTIQIPSINITDLQNFTKWDYSGAIEMLKPLNMSWAYDQYSNLVNIGWVYE